MGFALSGHKPLVVVAGWDVTSRGRAVPGLRRAETAAGAVAALLAALPPTSR